MSYLGPPPGYRHPGALQHQPGSWVPAGMWYDDLNERNRKAHEDAEARALYPKFEPKYLTVEKPTTRSPSFTELLAQLRESSDNDKPAKKKSDGTFTRYVWH